MRPTQAGQRVKPSREALEPSRMFWLGLGDYTRKNAAKRALDTEAARRGTVVEITPNTSGGNVPGAVVKWDDGRTSHGFVDRYELADDNT